MSIRNGVTVRGVSNGNERGSAKARRARKHYLLTTYQSDEGPGTCRCYRCGDLLDFFTVTSDRITPGCQRTAKYPNGGTYVRENIRPACEDCQSKVGGALAKDKTIKKSPKVRRGHRPRPLIEVLDEWPWDSDGEQTA